MNAVKPNILALVIIQTLYYVNFVHKRFDAPEIWHDRLRRAFNKQGRRDIHISRLENDLYFWSDIK